MNPNSTTKKRVIKEKPKKAIDVVKMWLKKNCTKGQPLNISYSHSALVITKEIVFAYAFDDTATDKATGAPTPKPL